MHIHEMMTRLKRIKNTEIKLLQHERSAAKLGAKCLLDLEEALEKIRNWKSSRDCELQLQYLENKSQKLRFLCEKNAADVDNYKQAIINLKEEYESHYLNHIERKQSEATRKKMLLTLTLTSNIYINGKVLPEALQGFSVQAHSDERRIIPFRFSTKDLKQDEAFSTIWGNEEESKNWEVLVFGKHS